MLQLQTERNHVQRKHTVHRRFLIIQIKMTCAFKFVVQPSCQLFKCKIFPIITPWNTWRVLIASIFWASEIMLCACTWVRQRKRPGIWSIQCLNGNPKLATEFQGKRDGMQQFTWAQSLQTIFVAVSCIFFFTVGSPLGQGISVLWAYCCCRK